MSGFLGWVVEPAATGSQSPLSVTYASLWNAHSIESRGASKQIAMATSSVLTILQGARLPCTMRDHALPPSKCCAKPAWRNNITSVFAPAFVCTASSVLPRRYAARWRRGAALSEVIEQQTAQEVSHKSVGFHPSIWGDFFLTHRALSPSQHTLMRERAEQLQVDVRKMIRNSNEPLQQLSLIYELQLLCIHYHFDKEIDEMLQCINNLHFDDNGDLHIVALRFYLLRKQGYKVSSDVFTKFEDEKGNFLTNNPRDLLMLYNAASLRTHGEIVLEEAISFAKRHLKSMVKYMDEPLSTEISYSLDIPLSRRITLFEIRHYMAMYEQEATRNGTILELAKLNFNLLQLQYQEELRVLTLWWKGLELESRLNFAGDRVVECYFWLSGVYFEPCYSRARIITTKMMAMITIFDDIYDVHGTSEECKLFTKAIESWDPNEANELPEYMKFVFQQVFHTFMSVEDELAPEEKYRMSHARKLMIEVVKSYNKENKWRDKGYIPATIEEHLHVSRHSIGCHQLACSSFVGMGDIATKQAFDWVISFPKIVLAMCTIIRLSDDLKSNEREKKMVHVASTIDSCMKEHKLSKVDAFMRIEELIEECWKDINEECLKHVQPMALLERIVNFARTSLLVYKEEDAFSNAYALKDIITSLYVDAIPIQAII